MFVLILGIICGVIGSLFVAFMKEVHMFRRRQTSWLFKNNWAYTIMVSAIILNLMFFIHIDQTSD